MSWRAAFLLGAVESMLLALWCDRSWLVTYFWVNAIFCVGLAIANPKLPWWMEIVVAGALFDRRRK